MKRLVLLILAFTLTLSAAQAQKPSLFEHTKSRGAAQWRSVGGHMVFQGKHEFRNFWVRGEDRNRRTRYRKNTLDKTVEPTYTKEEVARDRIVKVGEFTVTGPGLLGMAQRSDYTRGYPVVAIKEAPVNTDEMFLKSGSISDHYGRVRWLIRQYRSASDLSQLPQRSYQSISAGWIKFSAKGKGYGWVRPGQTKTFEVWAFNNTGGGAHARPGPTTFGRAKVEFEVWFFPRKEKPVAGDQPTNTKGDKPTRYYSRPHLGKTLAPSADNHVYAYSWQGWNQANWGKFENLAAGFHPTGGEKRTFLKFDLAGLPKDFSKATLKLYNYHSSGSHQLNLGVHRITSPWNEGRGTYKPATASQPGELTWNSQPKYELAPVVTFNPGPGAKRWVEVDVTALVKQWASGAPNHGLVIKGVGKMRTESFYNFRSREYKDPQLRPSLVITP